MLFFIFHLISITMMSSIFASSWPALMPDMDMDQCSFGKSKCVEYIIMSNIDENDLVVVWRRQMSKVIGHSLIQRIMNVANVLIATDYNSTGQVLHKYSRADEMLVATMMADGDDESFTNNNLSKGNVFIIETSVSGCDRAIASISKSRVYNSRGNFILLVSNERNDTMVDDLDDEEDDDDVATHSCEKEIKWKNHSHDDEQCDTVNINTFGNVTNPAGGDRKINDEKMIHGTLKHVFRLLWARYIFNAVIMLCETIDTVTSLPSSPLPVEAAIDVCAFYTWFPFDESSECGQRIEDFVKIDECVYDKNRNHLQFHYSEENKWYFSVSDGSEQGQINNRRLNENESNHGINNNTDYEPSRRNGNHVPNENKIFVGNVPHTYAYTFQTNKNFTNNISLFNVSPAMGGFEMKIANWSDTNNANDVDSIEHLNLCALNAFNPSVELFVINETRTNRQRMQNQALARNYFKYECREFGTIEFRKNRFSNDLPTPKTTNTNDAKIMRASSIIIGRVISNRRRPHFYEKIPNDLLGCVYDTIAFIWPPFVTPVTAAFYGLEHKLLLDVARHMNYRMNETYKLLGNESHVQDVGKTTYSYGILVNSSATLAFGNIYPKAHMQNKFDASIGYLYDHVNWAVPLAVPAPAWLNLVHCFR